LFGDNAFLKKYPYFLACAIPATFTVIAWLVTFFFLKETHPNPIPIKEVLGLDTPESKRLGDEDDNAREKARPLQELLTPRVIRAASSYAFLSLCDIAFRAVCPLFMSTPIALGGLGLSPLQIGNILSVFGVLNGIIQVFFFARIHDYFGSKKVFMAGVASAIPTFLLFPLMNVIAKAQGKVTFLVWFLVYLQVVLSIGMSLSYGASIEGAHGLILLSPTAQARSSFSSLPRPPTVLRSGQPTVSARYVGPVLALCPFTDTFDR